MKITATTNVYMTGSEYGQERFVNAMRKGDGAEIIDATMLYSRPVTDYVKVGTATVTLDVLDEDAIKLGFIDALKEKRKTVLAEAQREATRIDEQIQNLLAISYDGAAA